MSESACSENTAQILSVYLYHSFFIVSLCFSAGASVSQPGGLQPRGEVRQPNGGHTTEAASRETPVQPGLV